ncbi:HNH endonuclease [Methylomonas sp. EFPC1]|uniref:HNH endonuclease n=1 Tax=Methylomonas sp. EFPC1 TaxID=2812647 RepID=UPI0019673213|nr:HNH endonuclease [Methylomonas sp. EFPC1]QSA99940.1 HNH endonuclease [Methylomonas sp. EFPC1]
MPNNRKDRLSKKFDGECRACGATGVPLEIHYIVPLSSGGTDDESNLTLLCPNCNRTIANRQFTEIEFNHYLSRILDNSNAFHDIRMEERLSREKPFRADITAKSQDGKSWLIECKNASAFTPASA